ncbi:hypothetical protein SBV1_3070002 [Verrucomicrobia bacterium]|nr:hypothetical protein SBV1_3070002 [Verrucomicrobiota bacterium]
MPLLTGYRKFRELLPLTESERSLTEGSTACRTKCVPNSIRTCGGTPAPQGADNLGISPRHCKGHLGSVVVWLLLAGVSRSGSFIVVIAASEDVQRMAEPNCQGLRPARSAVRRGATEGIPTIGNSDWESNLELP